MQETKVSSVLKENEIYIREKCADCADILIRPMKLGEQRKVDCLMVYIEVAVSNMMLEDSALGKMMNHFWKSSPEQIREFVKNNSLGIADVKKLSTMEEAMGAMLAGNAVFFNLTVDFGFSFCYIFFLLFVFEPKSYLISCLGGLDCFYPVFTRSFRGSRCYNIADIGSLQNCINGHYNAIDFCTHHLISDSRVN